MRYRLLTTIRIALSLFFSQFLNAAVTPTSSFPDPVTPVLNKLSSISLKEAQQLAGRKFTLKEKVGFWIMKKQIQKGQKQGFSKLFKKISKHTSTKPAENGSKGEAALVFGIAALALLVIGFFVPYVIFVSPIAAILAIVLGTVSAKREPGNVNGKVGKLLGWISLGLFVALLIIAAIALSDGFY